MDVLKVLKGNIAYLLVSLLMGVTMVTLTVTIVHIMQGDRDSVKKFITWAVVSSIGILLLNLIGSPSPAGSELCEGVRNVVRAMTDILRVLMVIGALISIGIVIVKTMKGDKESAHHVLYWLVGFAGGLTLLTLLSNLL